MINKNIKVSDVFELPATGFAVRVNAEVIKEGFNDGVTPFDVIDTAVEMHDQLMAFVKTAASLSNGSPHNAATIRMLAQDILDGA